MEAFLLTKAYLCTGEKSWYLRIEHSVLKWFVQLIQKGVCWSENGWGDHYTPWSFFKELHETFQHVEITGKASECLWGAIKTTIDSVFCGEDTSEMVIVTKMLTIVWCRHYPEDAISRAFCRLGNYIIQQKHEIKTIVGKYVCTKKTAQGPSSNSDVKQGLLKLEKRQYDLSSMVDLVDAITCKHPESMITIVKGGNLSVTLLDGDKELRTFVKIIARVGCCGTQFVRESQDLL